MWTEFSDMYSGGERKLDYGTIYIEASEDEATRIFEDRFNRSPHNVTCECCGNDYWITEGDGPSEEDKQNKNILLIYKESK